MVKFLDNNSGFNQFMASRQGDKKPSRFFTMLWWAILFLGIWWLVGYFFAEKPKSEISNQKSEIIESVHVPSMSIGSDKISATVQGLRISKINLSDYENVALLSEKNEFVQIGLIATGTTAPMADTMWRATRMSADNAMVWRNGDGVDFIRTTKVDNYTITISDLIKNNSGRDIAFAPYVQIVRNADAKNVNVETGGVAMVNGDTEYESWRGIDKESAAYQTDSGFVGFSDQYWETIANTDAHNQTIIMNKRGDKYQAQSTAAPINIANGATTTITTKIFAGPRDPKILSASGIADLEKTMDYGWFWFLAQPMLWALNALHGFVMNYGVAIILLTIALRILMWPLTRKSYTSMAAMQKMQPELSRVQKLYKNDKIRLNMEMMKLYRTHKTSPMSGCLPMLLQIPIFFALYKALLISVPMRNAGFLWIGDLSAMDPYFILPILMGATMWFQQKLQSPVAPIGDDPAATMQRTMRWMPIMFTLLFAWMPAGLVLYWTVSNIFGIFQMWVIKRHK